MPPIVRVGGQAYRPSAQADDEPKASSGDFNRTINIVNYPPEYLAGIDLFNAEQFWHAHEEWETAWLAARDPQERLFFKGIIQTAAALVHWQRGNRKGLHRNWHKARAKLTQLPSPLMGLDLHALIAFMDRFEQAEGARLTPPQLILHTQR